MKTKVYNNNVIGAYSNFKITSCKVEKISLLGIFLAVLSTCSFAQTAEPADTIASSGPIILADDPSLVALDRLISLEYIKALPETSGSEKEVIETTTEVFAERMAVLNAQSPMDLVYNETVQAYINMYLNKKPELTARMIGLTAHYYPMINEKLDKNDLPLELSNLAVVESALNPSARSRAGAVGLWQFMYNTGKIYDLKVDSYVDQRQDPLKSTDAACEYLAFLHGIYDDWGLALAAYNAGPGNVNKAIRRSGGKRDYWEVKPWLPRETRGYVPAFIAVNYVMAHYADHGIVPIQPEFKYNELDTVQVQKKVEFDQLSAFVNVDEEVLVSLNPMYRKKIVPATPGQDHLVLPIEAVGLFLANEDSIYGFEPAPVVVDGFITKDVTIKHRVRSGEYLGGIAEKYGVGLSELKSWNGIRGTRIYPGKILLVHKSEKVLAEGTTKATKPVDTKEEVKVAAIENGDYRYHIVQKGDTLWDIANKYDGVTVGQLRSLNSDVNVKRLNPGQKIKIGPQG